jgi:hypothetical protein
MIVPAGIIISVFALTMISIGSERKENRRK